MNDAPTREEAVKAYETLRKWCKDGPACGPDCPFNDICVTTDENEAFREMPEHWPAIPEAPHDPSRNGPQE